MTTIAQIDTEKRTTMARRTASAEGAQVVTVMMTESVGIDLVGVGAGVRGAPEAEHLMETGKRTSKSNIDSGDILQPDS